MAAAAPLPPVGPQDADRRWEDEIVYVVILQKFFNGDPGNDIMARQYRAKRDRYQGGFWGGDLEGVRQKLDELADLGVTAILLYPVVQNDQRAFGPFLPTGYRPKDLLRVDENFGDMSTLKRLIDEAHAHRMRVILDLPLGFPGFEHPFLADPAKRDWFGERTRWGPRRWKVEKPEVAEYLIGVARFWKEQSGCDGFRLDSAQLHPEGFWKRFADQLHGDPPDGFLLLAEVAEHPRQIERMIRAGGFDSAYDFSAGSTLVDVLGKDGSVGLLSFTRNQVEPLYGRPRWLVAQIDNYEDPAFLDVALEPRQPRMLAAMTCLLALDRVPLIYSGDELGMAYSEVGTAFGEGRKASAFLHEIKRLVAVRKSEPALRRGAWAEVKCEPPLYAFLRTLGDDRILVVVNSSSEGRSAAPPIEGWTWKSLGLVDLVAGSVVKGAGDESPLELQRLSARVLKIHQSPIPDP